MPTAKTSQKNYSKQTKKAPLKEDSSQQKVPSTPPRLTDISGKLPPHSLEAEQSVLGSLLIDKEAIVRVADLLKPDDFYHTKHSYTYEVMLELYRMNKPIDLVSLANRLEERGWLADSGGYSYLASLAEYVPTASHVVHYAEIVARKKILRSLINASEEIAQLGYNERENIEQTLDEAEKLIFSIASRTLTQEFSHIKPPLTEASERLSTLHEGDSQGMRGVATGLLDLDNILSGLQSSDLIILASRPSVGKTSLAMSIARHVAVKHHQPVGIFSLEMSTDQLVDRLIAQEAGVNLWKLRTGRLKDEELEKIQLAIGNLADAPIYIDDEPSPNILHMRATARRLQSRSGLALIIVDYLQLIKPLNKSDSQVQMITEVSRSLKALARELNVPVLALSQLSRAVEHRSPQVPQLSDLRDSGSIEQDADVVLFLYREERDRSRKNPRRAISEIHIAKHRNGPTGKVEAYFDETQAVFRNLAKREAPPTFDSPKPAEE